jgi:hypothetical protein
MQGDFMPCYSAETKILLLHGHRDTLHFTVPTWEAPLSCHQDGAPAPPVGEGKL